MIAIGNNYTFNNPDMRALNDRILKLSNDMDASFRELTSAAEWLVACQGYQGNVATNVKTYIQNTYETTNNLFSMLALAILTKYSAYWRKYQTDVDKHYSANISTVDLMSVRETLKKEKQEIEEVKAAFLRVQTQLQSDGDLMKNFSQSRLNNSLNRIDELINQSQKLEDTIVKIESVDIQTEFTKIDDMFNQLGKLLDFQLGLNPTKPFEYAGYQKVLGEVGATYTALVTEVSSLQDVAQAAQEEAGQMAADELEDRKAREKKAAFWGFITDAVCTVATVVATATLGPVGAIVVGGVAGMVKSAVHEGLDQWAATGCAFGDLDWGRIAIKGAVGGLSGAATAAIGGAFSGVGSGFIGKTAAAIGKNVLSKATDMTLQGVETTLLSVHEGKPLSEAVSEGWAAATEDWDKKLLGAAASGLTSQITGTITGGMDDGWKKNLTEVASNAGVGIVDYGLSCAVNGEEFQWKDAFKSAGKAGAKTVINQASNWVKNDCLKLDEYGHSVDSDFKAVAVTYVIGSADKYLTNATGGMVDALIDGKSLDEAAKSFRLVDEEGKPTSVLMDLTTGGAKGAAEVYYDRNLSANTPPKVIKSDLAYVTDENGNILMGENGKPLMGYREEIISNDGKGHKIIQDRVYTMEEGSQDVQVQITVREKSNLNILGDGKVVGGGTGSTTVSDYPGMEYTEKHTKENISYTTRDGRVHTSESSSDTTVYRGDVVQEDAKSTSTVTDKKGREVSYSHSETTGMSHTSHTEETTRERDYRSGTSSETTKTTDREGRNSSGDFDKTTTTTEKTTADTRGDNKGAYSREKTTVTTEKDSEKGTSSTTTTSSRDSGHTGKEFQHTESQTTTTTEGNTTKTESSSYAASGKERMNGRADVTERTRTSSSSETTKTGAQTVTESRSESTTEDLKRGTVTGTERTETNDKTTTTVTGKDRTYTESSSDSTTEKTKGSTTKTETTVSESRKDTYKTEDGETHTVNRTDSATETTKNGEEKKTVFERTNASSVTSNKDHYTRTDESTSRAGSASDDYSDPKKHVKEEYDVQYKSDHKEVSGRIGTNAGINGRPREYEYLTDEEYKARKAAAESYSGSSIKGMKTAEELGLV